MKIKIINKSLCSEPIISIFCIDDKDFINLFSIKSFNTAFHGNHKEIQQNFEILRKLLNTHQYNHLTMTRKFLFFVIL